MARGRSRVGSEAVRLVVAVVAAVFLGVRGRRPAPLGVGVLGGPRGGALLVGQVVAVVAGRLALHGVPPGALLGRRTSGGAHRDAAPGGPAGARAALVAPERAFSGGPSRSRGVPDSPR